ADVLAKITANSDPIEDIHYLIVLARLLGPRTTAQTQATAAAMLNLDAKIVQRKLNRDTNWLLRIAEMHAELARKDSALNATMLKHAEFGRPDHVLFTRCPGFDRKAAAEIIVSRLERTSTLAWKQ